MKISSGLALAAAGFASAQVAYDNSSNTWSCPVANGSYCAGDSLQTNAIILCTNGVGYYTVCDGHLANRPPIDVYYAPCWQQDPSFGNATCSKNCTIFPGMYANDYANPYQLGSDSNCSYQAVDSRAYEAGYDFDDGSSGSNSTNSTGPYSNSTATTTSSGGSKTPTPSATISTTSGTSAATPIAGQMGTTVFGAAMLAAAALAL